MVYTTYSISFLSGLKLKAMSNENLRIKKLLNKLLKLHDYYLTLDITGKDKVLNASKPLIAELELSGVSRNFCLTFLAFGNEFLLYEFGVKLRA